MGHMLKKLREIWGYSVSDLAKKLKISKEELTLIENSTEDVGIDTLRKYADTLDIRITRIDKLSKNFNEYTDDVKDRNKYTKEFIKTLNDYVEM